MDNKSESNKPSINKKLYTKKRKRKKKKVKYRKMTFKFTADQKKAIEKYCLINRTTPVRFIKSLVNKRVEKYRDMDIDESSYVTENQLTLFNIEEVEDKKQKQNKK